MKHILESQQFSRDVLEIIFQKARDFETAFLKGQTKDLRLNDHLTMFSVFYEPSTRTRMSLPRRRWHWECK